MDPELSEEIQRFEERYAENPDSLVFARLADLYRKSGEPDRALGVLEDGLEKHPDYLSAHIVRARCLRDLGREAEAEREFERVLARDDQNLVALRSLAELARERGDRGEARRRYEDLLELDPSNGEALSALEELDAPRPPEPGPAEPDGAAEAGQPAEAPPDDAGEAIPADEEPDRPPAASTEASEEAGEAPEGPADGAREDDVPWWAVEESAPEAGGSGVAEEGDAPAVAGPEAETDEEDGVGEEPGEATEVFSLADAAPPEDAGPSAGDSEHAPPEDGGPSAGDSEHAPPEDAGPSASGSEDASREEAEFLGLADDEEAVSDAAGESPEGDIPAGEELNERIEEIGAEGGGGEAPEAEDDAEDLLTETLAGLYETQGFYREAVEMYEELLEERPDDEELRARLEAARSAVAGGEGDASASEPDDVALPEVEDTVEAEDAPATARDHLRALLRGEARREDGSDSDGSGRGP